MVSLKKRQEILFIVHFVIRGYYMNESHSKKVLIVEDNQEYALLLKQGLQSQGLLAVVAKTGQEGLVLAQSQMPDLIMIDIDLGPESQMNGITMAQKIKEKGIGLATIFLTNSKDMDNIGKAIEVTGNAGYIVKSDMHIDEVVSMVKDKLHIS